MRNIRNIRLWVEDKLSLDSSVALSEKQAHYLLHVMRCQASEAIRCFNATDGEFLCQIMIADKKKAVIKPMELLRSSETLSDVWLLFAPLKKEQTDFVIQKAVELGVAKIIPVITRYTNTEKVKLERLSASAAEAAEQCGRLSVPEIVAPIELNKLLSGWDEKRVLFFMDERRVGLSAVSAFNSTSKNPVAVLIGPEGGFSDEEASKLNEKSFVKNISLGPRILRAETAAAAALAVWQATAGDWVLTGETR